MIHRGILYAPVYIPPRLHFRAAFAFSPGVVISLRIFDDALFLRLRHRHYYYGDYYARKHQELPGHWVELNLLLERRLRGLSMR